MLTHIFVINKQGGAAQKALCGARLGISDQEKGAPFYTDIATLSERIFLSHSMNMGGQDLLPEELFDPYIAKSLKVDCTSCLVRKMRFSKLKQTKCIK